MKKILLFFIVLFIPLFAKASELKIIEVNFKNKEADWLKIKANPQNINDINLRGIQFEDDKVFKEIAKDFLLKPGAEAILYFNQDTEDNLEKNALYTKHKGLTGTTEQLIIKNNNIIIDAICWVNSKPTEKEKQDLLKLFQEKNWHSDDPKTCISSDTVKTNQSIIRKNFEDTNSEKDWILDSVESQTTSSSEEEHQNSSAASSPSTNKNTTSKKEFKNGDLSANIIISEILPNVSKDSNQHEWIELYNKGNKDISLSNWILDDIEGGSKPYKIPDTYIIKAKGYLIFSSQDTKLSLANTKDSVRLFDFNNKLIDEVSFEDTEKNQSFGRVLIQTNSGIKEEWSWLENISPGQQNPVLREIEGTIIEDTTFSDEFFFYLKDHNNKTYKIFFEEKVIPGPLARATFIKGTQIKAFIQNIPKNIQLKKYEILNTPQKETKAGNFNLLIALIVAFGLPVVFLLHKFLHHIKQQN